MSSISTHVGIDVSKDVLQVHIDRPKGRKKLKVDNNLEGIRALLTELGDGLYIVSLEATGRYEALARRELEKAGHEVHLQNPRRMRKLAEGLGYDAKTDPIDALTLAATVGICKKSVPRSELREGLGDISRTISALRKEQSGHKKRLKTPGFSEEVKNHLKALIRYLEDVIAALERDFATKVKQSELAERYALCQTVRGVAQATARIVVAELPEDLTGYTPRQIVSYGALCPIDNASGERVAKPKLKEHGNMHLKGAFYMPAIYLIGHVDWARNLYKRLVAHGRTHQQAIVPIMRRLLLQVIAVIKRGSAWTADPPQRA